jgi:iron complex transport system permease protein
LRRAWLRASLLHERLSGRADVWAALLGALLLAAAATSAAFGAAPVPLGELPRALFDASHPLHGPVFEVRVPRIVGAVGVGASLGVAGALMQTVVRNPLADPGLLGVSAAAGAAGLLALVLWPEHPEWVPGFAFAGGLSAVALVLGSAFGTGRARGPLRVVLSGVALQALFFALIALVTFFFADRAPAFASFVVGSLNGLGWSDAALLAGPAALGIALALAFVRVWNALLLDDAAAAGVGLAVRRARLGASAIAALLAAGAVSVAGLVGFVGLVVPNAVRLLVGPDHRALLPLCALGGAALVVASDAVARTATAPLELPVGALLALLGAPYFLWLLWWKLP